MNHFSFKYIYYISLSIILVKIFQIRSEKWVIVLMKNWQDCL